MPKKTHRRKPKGPEVPPRLVTFLMEHEGMSRREATRAAAAGVRVYDARRGKSLMTRLFCDVCESPVGEPYDVMDDAQAAAARDVARAHTAACKAPAV